MIRLLNRIQLHTYNTKAWKGFLVFYVLLGFIVAVPLALAQETLNFFQNHL